MYSVINNLIKYILIVCFLGSGFYVSAQEEQAKDSVANVTGYVYDAVSGEPISAASIQVVGFSAAITEDDGSFTIAVFDKSTVLFVTKENYQKKIVSLKGRSEVEVKLYKEHFNSLHDLANYHYYQEELSQSTKSLSLLDTYESWKNTGSSAEKTIENAAGIHVKSRSGSPGMGSDMFIRGLSSMHANNQPLIVVDGVIYDNSFSPSIVENAFFNPLSYIDVKDIASITIEKDGGSMYGAKGANGVIYITTERADRLATKIEVTSHGTLNMAPDNIPVMNADQYRSYLGDMLQSQGLTGEQIASMPYMNDDPSFMDYKRYHNNTNWQDRVKNDSYTTKYGLKISGGDQVASYLLSVGYLDDNGVVENTNFSRFNSRLNADIKMTDKFSINASLGISQENRDMVDDGLALTSNPTYLSLVKSPLLHSNVISGNGFISPILEDVDVFGIGNPQAVVDGFTAHRRNYRFFGNMKMNYDILKNLTLSSTTGITFDKSKENLFSPHIGLVDEILKSDIGDNRIGSGAVKFKSIYSDTRLSYHKIFNKIHKFNSVGGYRVTINESSSNSLFTYNSANDQLTSVNDGDMDLAQLEGHVSKWNDMTFYLSNTYSFKNRYLLSVDASLNGSSRFGDEVDGVNIFSNAFGLFPSVSLGWIASSENFMANVNAIDFLKLRTSYSITGNDDIGNYASGMYYTRSQYLKWSGIVRGSIYNPGLKWETVTKMNAGIDLALFDERISLSADYYYNITSDMLTQVPVQVGSGFSYYLGNEGEMENTGFEFALNARILQGEFNWDLGVSVSHYVNKLTKLPVDKYVTEIAGANILSQVGKPVGLFYGYKTDGVFSSDQQAIESGLLDLKENTTQVPFQGGDVRFVEVQKDNVIDENDMQVIGDPNPTVFGSVSNNFTWKGLSLNTLLTYSVGGDIYNHQRYLLESMSGYENQTTVALNRWTTNGQTTDVPRAAYGDPNGNSRFSDRWIEDGSYVRIKSVTLSYQIPLKSEVVKHLEVYANGSNLYTFTNYLGGDPDNSFSSNTLSQGIDIGLAPQFRTVSFGVKIGL